MSTTITSHLDAIRILSLTTPRSHGSPIETLVKTVQAQANDLAEGLDRAHSDRDEARSESRPRSGPVQGRDRAGSGPARAGHGQTEIAKTSTVALLRELAGSPAKLLPGPARGRVHRGRAGISRAGPRLWPRTRSRSSDPAQHGPSLIAVLVKV